MSLRIEDYALIGDTHTGALVGRDGSIDWLCVPQFDSAACFAALLGDSGHGRWLVGPAGGQLATERRYRPSTLVLEQVFETEGGTVRLIDFMPPRHRHPRIGRIVEGLSGEVEMTTELVFRFDYGSTIPWVHRIRGGVRAVSGPNQLEVMTPVKLRGRDLRTAGQFVVKAGQRVPFSMHWSQSFDDRPQAFPAEDLLGSTVRFWRGWCRGISQVHGDWQEQANRSLITLKALTYAPTGGIIAAPTTSLPEDLGGERNWDYRYCWVRDATLTLEAMLESGRKSEASKWMWWLVRAAAGAPEQLRVLYGPAGERRVPELTVDSLPGYEGSAPVRIGNDAAKQFQLDVYGELMDAVYRCRSAGIRTISVMWSIQRVLANFVAQHWTDPDEGIWEVRGPRRHFVHSKVMAWVAMDRAVRSVIEHRCDGPVEQWTEVRDAIHAEVCVKGWNEQVGAFTQYYGSDDLDASLLMMPLVGFLPPDDERVRRTVEAIERDLTKDGLVRRYQNKTGVDGLSGDEGAFLPCSFWLADCLTLMGRVDDARRLFERLLGLANDVGLFSEEYDPRYERLVGNFPQAFTHVGVINTARNLARAQSAPAPPLRPAAKRSRSTTRKQAATNPRSEAASRQRNRAR